MYILILLFSFPLFVVLRRLLFVPIFAIVYAGILLVSFSLSLSSIKSFFSLLPYRLRWRHCHGPFLFGRLYSSSSLSSSLSLHHLCFLCFLYSIFHLMHLTSPFLSCLHLFLVFIFSFFIFLFFLCFSIHRPPVALFLRPLDILASLFILHPPSRLFLFFSIWRPRGR